MTNYRIFYENERYGDDAAGLAVPMFIRNGTYFYVTLDVYADGVVDAWGLVPLDGLQAKVNSGWVTSEAPVGAHLSIHDLGSGTVKAAEWQLPKEQIVSTIQALFQRFSPVPPFNLEERRKVLAAEWKIAEKQVGQSRSRLGDKVYRLAEDGTKIRGATIPLFQDIGGDITLTHCFIYADERLSIGYEGELLTLDAMQARINTSEIRTAVDDDTWIHLPGLGRFQVTTGHWHVEKVDIGKQVLNWINVFRGQPDLITACHQAFEAYEADPTDANRERLRRAYQAVPAHHRVYTQRDQDAKDHDIRRILAFDDED